MPPVGLVCPIETSGIRNWRLAQKTRVQIDRRYILGSLSMDWIFRWQPAIDGHYFANIGADGHACSQATLLRECLSSDDSLLGS